VALDPAHFQAGYPGQCHAVWEQYFKLTGDGCLTVKQKEVLSLLRDGYKLDFVPVNSPSQQNHPDFRDKIRELHEMLSAAIGPSNVEPLLRGDTPKPITFKNRDSVQTHSAFVEAEIQVCLATGAVKEWAGEFEPVVINALGVVDKAGGHRMILDPRYNNAFCRYQPFSYESVTDVKDYLQEEDLLILTDLKSGYHHIPLHESAHPYMCSGSRARHTTTLICLLGLPRHAMYLQQSWRKSTSH
jgi:hypothetical protein